MIVATLAVIGALVTIIACVRLVVSLRARAPREVIVGWFALMLAPPIVVFSVDALVTRGAGS